MSSPSESFQRFVDIIAALRHPETGCPWDLEQTHHTLRPFLIEEAYELLDAIEREDDAELRDELGDVLLQVVLHAQLASDRKAFQIADVVDTIADKMVRRHPHVFGDVKVDDTQDVYRNWEAIKQSERKDKQDGAEKESMLDGIPRSMPALVRGLRLGQRAAKVDFDWDSLAGVLAKVDEEMQELRAELPSSQEKQKPGTASSALEHELGDLLFAICQLARWLGLSAEDCLHKASNRFTQRFSAMEDAAEQELGEYTQAQLEQLWQTAKKATAK